MHIHKFEKIWLTFGIGTLIAFLAIVGVSAFAMGNTPPSSMTTIDPEKVTETAPFDEPGIKQIGENEYEVVMIASAFFYTPTKIEVPKGAKVTFKVATTDVIHGFEIVGTNVNMMVEPGYVSEYTKIFNETGEYLILCNEYCGIGHHTMNARIEVVE